MYLQRSYSGELTLTFERDDFVALITRSADQGMSPEAYVESLVRDAYRHPLITREGKDPGPVRQPESRRPQASDDRDGPSTWQ